MPALAASNTAIELLFANLNGAAVGTQADIWAAFADGGAGRGVTALVIDTDAEIIHVNGAVFALGVEPEADFRRHFNLDSSAHIVDIDISERRFWANGNQAIAVFHFNFAADFVEMNFIGASVKLDRPGTARWRVYRHGPWRFRHRAWRAENQCGLT